MEMQDYRVANDHERISVKLGVSEAAWDGSMLRMDTGEAVRQWRLTSKGLQTLSLARAGGGEWIEPDLLERDGCDWFIWGFHQRSFRAELREATIVPVTGDPLGNDRIEAVFVFDYPDVAIGLRYRIWAYSDAPGLRTHAAMRHAQPTRHSPQIMTHARTRTRRATCLIRTSGRIHPPIVFTLAIERRP